MKVSLNEVHTLVSKALQGLGCYSGDAEDTALMTTWLEARQLGGLQSLSSLFFDHQTSADNCAQDKLTLFNQLATATLSIERAYLQFFQDGSGVRTINSPCAELLLGYLSLLNKRNSNDSKNSSNQRIWLEAKLYSEEQLIASASFDSQHQEPEVYAVSQPLLAANRIELMIEQSEVKIQKTDELSAMQWINEVAMQERLQDSLCNTVFIDDTSYKALYQYANRLLVPATEASRAGAGAGTNDFD